MACLRLEVVSSIICVGVVTDGKEIEFTGREVNTRVSLDELIRSYKATLDRV